MKIEVTKETRIAMAGALIGGFVGAVGGLLYHRARTSKGALPGEKLVAAKEEALSLQRVASLLWAGVTVVREIIEFGKTTD